MTVHVDKVKPFLGEVPKTWLAGEPSSEVRELPERANDQETLVKAPYDEPLTSSMLSPNLKERAFQESTMKSMELDHWKDQDARYEHRST